MENQDTNTHAVPPFRPAEKRRLWTVTALSVGLVAVSGALYLPGSLNHHPVAFLTLYSLMFGLMIAAWFVVRRGVEKQTLLLIIAAGILARIVATGVEPSLSDDVYRYIWDGRLTLHGENPYQAVPSDPALGEYREKWPELFEELNSPGYFSVYPPLSQALFAAGAWGGQQWFGENVAAEGWIIRLLFALCDGGTVVALAWLLMLLRLPPAPLVFYAWNPLPIVEFGSAGHSDSPMMLALVLGLCLMAKGRRAGSATLLGLAVLSKLLPVVFIPFWMNRLGWRYLGLVGGVVATGFALFYQPELFGNIFQSVRLYYEVFWFNSGISHFLASGIGGLGVEAPHRWAGRISGGIFAAALLGSWIGVRRGWITLDTPRDLIKIMIGLLTVYLVVSSTVHPWYLGWVLVFMPVLRMKSWLFMSYALAWTYLYYHGLDPGTYRWMLNGIWTVFFLLLAWDLKQPFFQWLMRYHSKTKYHRIAPFIVGEKVLDVGAAEGWVAYHASLTPGREMTLLDVTDLNQSPLPLRLYDGRSIPYPDNDFDTVLVLLTLHHCPKPEQVLQEAARVCRRRLIITESVFEAAWDFWLLRTLDKWVNGFRSGFCMEEGQEFKRVEEWKEQFESHGLNLILEKWLSRFVHKQILFVLEKPACSANGRRLECGAGRF